MAAAAAATATGTATSGGNGQRSQAVTRRPGQLRPPEKPADAEDPSTQPPEELPARQARRGGHPTPAGPDAPSEARVPQARPGPSPADEPRRPTSRRPRRAGPEPEPPAEPTAEPEPLSRRPSRPPSPHPRRRAWSPAPAAVRRDARRARRVRCPGVRDRRRVRRGRPAPPSPSRSTSRSSPRTGHTPDPAASPIRAPRTPSPSPTARADEVPSETRWRRRRATGPPCCTCRSSARDRASADLHRGRSTRPF